MPEATQLIQATQPHRNHGLFSDHYLYVTLPERPEWKGLVEQARPVMEGISRVFDSYAPSDNEAQTEEDLVRLDRHSPRGVTESIRAEDPDLLEAASLLNLSIE